MTARCLFFLNVLTGSVGTPGGTVPNSWTKFVPAPYARPPHPDDVERADVAEGVSARVLRDELPPAALPQGEARHARRVLHARLQPGVDEPDGFSWMEVLRDESMIGRHAALTPVWSETAWFADYVLPVGLGSERHDLASFETHAGSWIGFRQPVKRVLRGAARRGGRRTRATRIPAKCGKRTSSGSSSRGASIPTARWASASTSSRRTAPGEKLDRRILSVDLRELGARACPRRRPPRASRRSSTCGSTRRSKCRSARMRGTKQR